MTQDYREPVRRILRIALLLNCVVALAKTAYGFWSGTLSMIADGLHSFADAGASILGLVSLHVASRPSDRDHHYGHHKYETIAALGIGGVIALTAWEILKGASHRLFYFHLPPTFHPVGGWIMFVTMAINGAVSWYERRKAVEYRSPILAADGYHTASDFFVSLSVLGSLFFIRAGFPKVDAALCLGIGLYIGFISFRIVKENVLVLSDAAFLDPAEIKRAVLRVDGVLGCHRIRTRGREGNMFIDLHIQIDPATDTARSHKIVHAVEEQIHAHIEGVRDILIHTEPYPDEDEDEDETGRP